MCFVKNRRDSGWYSRRWDLLIASARAPLRSFLSSAADRAAFSCRAIRNTAATFFGVSPIQLAQTGDNERGKFSETELGQKSGWIRALLQNSTDCG